MCRRSRRWLRHLGAAGMNAIAARFEPQAGTRLADGGPAHRGRIGRDNHPHGGIAPEVARIDLRKLARPRPTAGGGRRGRIADAPLSGPVCVLLPLRRQEMLVDAFAAVLTCMTAAGGAEIAQPDWPQPASSSHPTACPIAPTRRVEPCPACSADFEQTNPASTRTGDYTLDGTACGADVCTP